MDDSEKGKPKATATIQIDLSQVQLIDPEAAANSPESRKAPPPLPPSEQAGTARTASLGPGRAPGAGSRPGPTPIQVGIIAFCVAAAIAGGLVVGQRVRGKAAPAPAPASSGAASAPAAAAAPSAGASVLTIPPIEVK